MRKKRLVGPHYPPEVEGQIDEYADKLVTALEDSGAYTGTAVEHHPHARRLILYGVGDDPPKSVAAVIQFAPDVVEVVWRPAPYTCAELAEECGRIMERFPQLTGGGPTNGGTRLEFMTTDPDLLASSDPQAALGSSYPVLIEYCECPEG